MKEKIEIQSMIINFLKQDEDLQLFSLEWMSKKSENNKNFFWLGLKNLNRCIYLSLIFYNFYFEKLPMETSFVIDKKSKELIFLEVKNIYLNLLKNNEFHLLKYENENLPTALLTINKNVYKFMKTNYDKFNNLVDKEFNSLINLSTSKKINSLLMLHDQKNQKKYKKYSFLIFNS